MGEAVFLYCWLFGLRLPALELAGCWIEPGLGAKMGTSGRPHANWYSLDQEFCGGLVARTQHSHHEGSGLTAIWWTKTSEATWCSQEKKKKEKKTNRQWKPRQTIKTKPMKQKQKQTKHKEAKKENNQRKKKTAKLKQTIKTKLTRLPWWCSG